jgi:hypothetical protein
VIILLIVLLVILKKKDQLEAIGVKFVKKHIVMKIKVDITVSMEYIKENIDVKYVEGVDYVNIKDKNILVKNAAELQSVNIKN